MTVTLNGVVVYGYEASCSCGWVGSWADVPSMAGFEFCPSCRKRYVGFITHARVDRRPTKHAPDVVESAASISISTASEVSAPEAESTPATTQVM